MAYQNLIVLHLGGKSDLNDANSFKKKWIAKGNPADKYTAASVFDEKERFYEELSG